MADFRNFVIVLLIIIGYCLLHNNFERLTQTMPWTKTLKQAFKAAMKTGRIKQLDTRSDHIWQDIEMMEKLQKCSHANLTELEWKEFESLDDAFRRYIATGNQTKAYTHPNPGKWWLVLNIIASAFIRDDEPLGNTGSSAWHLRKLKFAKRVMLKFPISIPDALHVEGQSESEMLTQEIVWCSKFVQIEIGPCFDKMQCQKKPITKEKLATGTG